MLHLLKDKNITHVTFTTLTDCYLMQTNGAKHNQIEKIDIKLFKDKKIKSIQKCKKIKIHLSSQLCRFAMLPPMKQWVDDNALAYLIEQQFKNKYPDYNEEKFTFVHSEIYFDQPCVLIAVPKDLMFILQDMPKDKIQIVSPSIITIWNFYRTQLDNSSLLIIEDQLAFLVKTQKGCICSIDTFPNYYLSQIEKDYIFNFNKLNFKDKINLTDDDSFVKELCLPEEWNICALHPVVQVLNLMET